MTKCQNVGYHTPVSIAYAHLLLLPYILTWEMRSARKGMKEIILKSFMKEGELEAVPQGLVDLIEYHHITFHFSEMKLVL